ncbi:hypothetical protein RSOLAG1IB_03834 [Rhizoctonia solani AG-1 IB]|uniref:Uncharacterized protein n=1 Tax=Thanatephorus cucumeris (strain AG1-IB / isolate 7/3/14) TaxID=1108050 RepID=A0A0B7FRM3_THACB|nr:hypothetical protein RSOLAG1IB_03834 [Rhizoctonia solani AG-1 IB]
MATKESTTKEQPAKEQVASKGKEVDSEGLPLDKALFAYDSCSEDEDDSPKATSEPTEPIKMSKDLFIWLLDMAKKGIVIEDWVKARGPAETNDEGLGGVGAEDSEVLLMISD